MLANNMVAEVVEALFVLETTRREGATVTDEIIGQMIEDDKIDEMLQKIIVEKSTELVQSALDEYEAKRIKAEEEQAEQEAKRIKAEEEEKAARKAARAARRDWNKAQRSPEEQQEFEAAKGLRREAMK